MLRTGCKLGPEVSDLLTQGQLARSNFVPLGTVAKKATLGFLMPIAHILQLDTLTLSHLPSHRGLGVGSHHFSAGRDGSRVSCFDAVGSLPQAVCSSCTGSHSLSLAGGGLTLAALKRSVALPQYLAQGISLPNDLSQRGLGLLQSLLETGLIAEKVF
jgi:hypothetical protein